MCPRKSVRPVWIALLALCTASWIACTKSSSNVAASSDGGKIPITTSSEEARKEFLTGRDLSERLLAQESLAHFDKALALIRSSHRRSWRGLSVLRQLRNFSSIRKKQ